MGAIASAEAKKPFTLPKLNKKIAPKPLKGTTRPSPTQYVVVQKNGEAFSNSNMAQHLNNIKSLCPDAINLGTTISSKIRFQSSSKDFLKNSEFSSSYKVVNSDPFIRILYHQVNLWAVSHNRLLTTFSRQEIQQMIEQENNIKCQFPPSIRNWHKVKERQGGQCSIMVTVNKEDWETLQNNGGLKMNFCQVNKYQIVANKSSSQKASRSTTSNYKAAPPKPGHPGNTEASTPAESSGVPDSSISIDIPATNHTIASYNLNKKYDALDHLLELGALQKMNFLCLQELPIKRTLSIPQGYSIASLC